MKGVAGSCHETVVPSLPLNALLGGGRQGHLPGLSLESYFAGKAAALQRTAEGRARPMACPPEERSDRSGSAARAGEQPDDQADHRQQEHQQDPQHLAAGAGAGAEDVDDGPDVEGQDDEAEDAADFNVHGRSPASLTLLREPLLGAAPAAPPDAGPPAVRLSAFTGRDATEGVKGARV